MKLRHIPFTAASNLLLLAGIAACAPAGAAVSVYGGMSKSGGFSICVQSGATLAEARSAAASGCNSYPDNACVEMASCADGGYASAVFTYTPSVTIAAACGFPTQAAADQAAMAKCGSGCMQGEQKFDAAPAGATACGTYATPESGCAGGSVAPTAVPGATAASDAERIFKWAEAAYSEYFAPKGGPTQELAGYTYRYYPYTAAYLGIKEGKVYALIPALSGSILEAGTVAQFVGLAAAAGN